MMISIIDSGVGGLTVWRHIHQLLPRIPITYIADAKNAPYGDKSEEKIIHLVVKLVEYLEKKQIKTIIIACNTMSVVALKQLRAQFPQIVFIGTVPAIKKACEISRNKRIGIFTTIRTAESQYLSKLTAEFASECSVTVVGTNKLVPLIEKGRIDTQEMYQIVKEEIIPFQKEQVDTLVLGCTHYPLFSPILQKLMPAVTLLDSGEAIARQAKRIISDSQIMDSEKRVYKFITSGDKDIFARLISRIIDEKNLSIQQKTFA